MPQVVNANILQAGARPHALPKWLKVGEPGAGQGADNHPGVSIEQALRSPELGIARLR
jgi:hypothetical protein